MVDKSGWITRITTAVRDIQMWFSYFPPPLEGPFSPRGSGFGSHPACVAVNLVETGGAGGYFQLRRGNRVLVVSAGRKLDKTMVGWVG